MLNMFRAACRSSSGTLTVFVASGLHTHVVTGRRPDFPLKIDYGRSPHAYVNQRLQIQLEFLIMSGMPLGTCWAFNERWNNKFYYKVANCWLFLLRSRERKLFFSDNQQSSSLYYLMGTRWRSWLRHCRKVAGSISDGVTGIFYWRNTSGRTVALGSAQLLTWITTRRIRMFLIRI
jgi:hypothetical protein